ncbi:hypothetical protein ACEPAI_3278 [Sanghuangporus weigelae]
MATIIELPKGSSQNMAGPSETGEEGRTRRSPASQAFAFQPLESLRNELSRKKKLDVGFVDRLMMELSNIMSSTVAKVSVHDKSLHEMQDQLRNVSDSVGDLHEAQTQTAVQVTGVQRQTARIQDDVTKIGEENEQLKTLTNLNTNAILGDNESYYALTIRKILEWGRVEIAKAFIDYERWRIDEERKTRSGRSSHLDENSTGGSTRYFVGMINLDKKNVIWTSTNIWGTFCGKLAKFCSDHKRILSASNVPPGSLLEETESQSSAMPPPPASALSGGSKAGSNKYRQDKSDRIQMKELLPTTVGELRKAHEIKDHRALELFAAVKDPLQCNSRSIAWAKKTIADYEDSLAVLGNNSASPNDQLQKIKNNIESYVECEEVVRHLSNAIALISNERVLEVLCDRTDLYDFLVHCAHGHFIPDEKVMEAVDFMDNPGFWGGQHTEWAPPVKIVACLMLADSHLPPGGSSPGGLSLGMPSPAEKGKAPEHPRSGQTRKSEGDDVVYLAPKPVSVSDEPGPSAPRRTESLTLTSSVAKRRRKTVGTTETPRKKMKLEPQSQPEKDTSVRGGETEGKKGRKKTRRREARDKPNGSADGK